LRVLQAAMKRKAKLLFHSPCFDGIASAVLASDYLRNHAHWDDIECASVNYGARDQWLSTTFDAPTAVVDFLYHPDAFFWADHHRSAFLTREARIDFERRDPESAIYDAGSDSCAGLLWRTFDERSGYRNESFAELVRWAEKIDAARYESVDEALSFSHPALQISASLAVAPGGHSERLVQALATHSLAEVSEMPWVHEFFLDFASSMAEGLARFEASACLRDDMVIFDVDGRGVVVPRYAPYRFYPRARYSIGVIHHDSGAKITAMRNPWMDFESVPLGDIFAPFGGGGHQRVASVFVPEDVDAQARLSEIVSAVAAADRGSMVAAR
jgi:hypothetical protein